MLQGVKVQLSFADDLNMISLYIGTSETCRLAIDLLKVRYILSKETKAS